MLVCIDAIVMSGDGAVSTLISDATVNVDTDRSHSHSVPSWLGSAKPDTGRKPDRPANGTERMEVCVWEGEGVREKER